MQEKNECCSPLFELVFIYPNKSGHLVFKETNKKKDKEKLLRLAAITTYFIVFLINFPLLLQ